MVIIKYMHFYYSGKNVVKFKAKIPYFKIINISEIFQNDNYCNKILLQ